MAACSPQSGQDGVPHFPTGTGGVMSKFERLLVAGSTELPDCRCTAEMNLTAIVPAGVDTESFGAHTVVVSLD